MSYTKDYNHYLWTLTFIALIVGLVILISASSVTGAQRYNDVFYYVKKQIVQGVLLGLFLAWIVSKIDYHKWRKWALMLLVANLGFISLGFVPAFQVAGTLARRWVRLGPISMQPSEFLKVTMILFIATLLAKYSLRRRRKLLGKPFILYLLTLMVVGGILIIQPSTGTVFVLGASTLLMYLIAGMSGKQFGLIVLGALLIGGIVIMHSPYRMNRLTSFATTHNDPLGKGYQIIQSLIGIGSGGVLGVGFGRSVQKFNYLPESYTDAIFSIIGEELGFIGAVAIIILYGLILRAGWMIAKHSRDNFGQFLAIGLTSNIIIGAIINISTMVKLFPITGIPLPFISYGGSAMIANLISIGLLSNIAQHS